MSRRRRAASCLTGEARPDDDGDSEVSSFDGETGRHGGAGVGLEDRSADAGKKEAGIVGDGEVVGEAWTSAARETRRSPKLAGGPSRASRPADAPAHGGCRRSLHAAGAMH